MSPEVERKAEPGEFANGDTRVLLALPYHPSPPSGGPNSVAYNTVEGLKKRHDRLEAEGIDIIVLSSRGDSTRPQFVSDPDYPRLLYVYYDPVRPHALTGDLQSLIRHQFLDGRIDLTHSHTLYDAVASTVLGRTCVLTLHGIVWREKHHVEDAYSKLKYRVKERRFKYLTDRVEKIVAISPYVVETVREQFDVDEDAFTFIENPISDDFFELPGQTDADLVLCPGVISPRKNQLALVRAIGLLEEQGREFRVVFTGSVYDADYYQSLRSAAKRAGVEDRVEFAGHVPREELLDRFVRAGIVCLPSLQETAPMIVAEAMASGTPVVASNVGGVTAMIRDGTDGYVVPPNDDAALADRLGRLLADEDRRSRFGTNARDEASRWRSERIADELVDLYAAVKGGEP